jgi:hypothetical protein
MKPMHDLGRLFRTKLKLSKSSVEIGLHTWLKSFSAHKNNPEVFSTVVKLALFPFSIFSKNAFADSKRKKLTSSAVTNFWARAYRLLMAPWAHSQTYAAKANFEERNQSALEDASYSQAPAVPAKDSGSNTPPPPLVAISENDSSPKATPASTEDKGIVFSAGTHTSGIFISRPPHKFVQPVKPKADARKHKAIYYTVTLQ